MKKSIRMAAVALSVLMLAGCSAPGSSQSVQQPTAAPTAEPTPTPAPVNNTNPLTGQTTDTDYNNQRPVAVTIRNGDGATPPVGCGQGRPAGGGGQPGV